MEVIEEKPILTSKGIIQSVRYYNYETNEVIIKRKLNGKTILKETFYLD